MKTSESIAAIAAALAKAQAQFGPLIKGSSNPFFKSSYADLASVVDVARGPLSEHGLCYVQTTDEAMDGICIETTLMHESGEWLQGCLKMPVVKEDPQSYGSTLTYARRYALQAMLGLAAEDDDGEAAMNRKKEQENNLLVGQQLTFKNTILPGLSDLTSLQEIKDYCAKHKAGAQKIGMMKALLEAYEARKTEIETIQE
jgi:hypothetical protein